MFGRIIDPNSRLLLHVLLYLHHTTNYLVDDLLICCKRRWRASHAAAMASTASNICCSVRCLEIMEPTPTPRAPMCNYTIQKQIMQSYMT
jgi:hypothetical protein